MPSMRGMSMIKDDDLGPLVLHLFQCDDGVRRRGQYAYVRKQSASACDDHLSGDR